MDYLWIIVTAPIQDPPLSKSCNATFFQICEPWRNKLILDGLRESTFPENVLFFAWPTPLRNIDSMFDRKQLKWIKQKLSCKSCSNKCTVQAQLKCCLEAVLPLPTQTQVTQTQYFLPSVAPGVPAAMVPADSVIMRSNAEGRRASLMSQVNHTRRKRVLSPNIYPQSRESSRQTMLWMA